MKKKITIILLLAIVSVGSVSAQRIGLEGSYNTGLLHSKKSGDDKTNAFHGWDALFRYEQFLDSASHWSLNIGLGWRYIAGRYGVEWYIPYSTCTRFTHEIVVPLDLAYYFDLNEKKRFRLSVFGGPRMGMGLFGSYGNHYYMATREYDKVNPYNGSFRGGEMNRVSLAVGAGVGIEWYGLMAKVNYDFPCTNLAHDGLPDELYRHQFRFTVGYMLDLRPIIKRRRENKIPIFQRENRQMFGLQQTQSKRKKDKKEKKEEPRKRGPQVGVTTGL